MTKKLYFLGGIAAAAIIVTLGINLASAAIDNTPTAATIATEASDNINCGCGKTNRNGNGPNKNSCGCGQKGSGFVDNNQNGICDHQE